MWKEIEDRDDEWRERGESWNHVITTSHRSRASVVML